jgi:predicted permease
MVSLMPDDMPPWLRFDLDARFAAFCTLITVAAAVLFGLAPALHVSGVDTRGSLQDAAQRISMSRSRRATLSSLVVGEIGLALILLISAGLLVEAFRKVLHVDPGFRPENVITYSVALPNASYAKPEERLAFFLNLLDRLRALPGVRAAGATSAPPLGSHWGTFVIAEGARPLGPKEQNPVVLQIVATPGYFDAIGMTLLAGRQFEDADGGSNHPPVAIVNETFAKRYWPRAQDAIGKRVRYSWKKDQWMQVIGVSRDTKHYGLDQEMRPSIFIPLRQFPQRDTMSLVLRAAINPQLLIGPARDLLRQMDADLPMFEIRTMTEKLDRSLWARRAYSWLFGAFAVVALVLAAAGVYGVVSYAISQRTHEIGIRMALGARPGQVLREVLAGGMVLVFAGAAVGLMGAILTARLLDTLLFGISGKDPLIYAAVVLGVALVGLVANFVPARRAASVDPLQALRAG